jgi:hypothetical protein
MGVPPASGQQFQPVKGSDGNDFVRIYLGRTTLDGARKTADLMKQWRGGADSVRNMPADRFSALQVWSKTRAALAGYKRGRPVRIGTVGPWHCVVSGGDRGSWLDDGSQRDIGQASGGFATDDVGLSAALVVLGVEVLGMSGLGDVAFCPDSLKKVLGAAECAAKWPELVTDKDSPAAYFAAADYAREMSLRAIRECDPMLYIKKMKEMGKFSHACISQRQLEEKDENAVIIAQKIGL